MADMEVLAPGGHQHLVDNIKEQLDLKADAAMADAVDKVARNQVTREVEGELVSVEDAYAAPMLDMVVDGKSTQDGTPTPDAPVEIESVENPELTFAGKNLLPRTLYASTYNALDDGGYYVKSTSFAWSYANSCARVRLPAGTYTASAELISAETGNSAEIRVFDSANTQLARTHLNAGTSATFTLAEETSVGIGIKLYATNNRAELQVQAGSVASAYQPHVTPTTVTLPVTLRSLPDGTKDTLALSYLRPSTREGWSWYTPTLTQNTRYARLTNFSQFATLSNGHHRVRHGTIANAGATHSISNRFVYNSSTYNYGNPGDYYISSGYMYCIVPDELTTLEAVNEWAADNVAVLQFASSPATTTLDPIELPVLPAPIATVYSDPVTGLIIEYVRDTQLVIDSLNAEIDRAHAAIAPVEHGTSSANYAVGSYLMLDGTFCKVTSAIATGETIAIGTNVVATTVDAELASLA